MLKMLKPCNTQSQFRLDLSTTKQTNKKQIFIQNLSKRIHFHYTKVFIRKTYKNNPTIFKQENFHIFKSAVEYLKWAKFKSPQNIKKKTNQQDHLFSNRKNRAYLKAFHCI